MKSESPRLEYRRVAPRIYVYVGTKIRRAARWVAIGAWLSVVAFVAAAVLGANPLAVPFTCVAAVVATVAYAVIAFITLMNEPESTEPK